MKTKGVVLWTRSSILNLLKTISRLADIEHLQKIFIERKSMINGSITSTNVCGITDI